MKLIFLLIACFPLAVVHAQKTNDSTATKNLLDSINRLIDRAVVKKDIAPLEKFYADDFYFLHATGKVDNKTSWLKGVSNSNNNTLSREHDSVVVELHENVALVTGNLFVRFPANTKAGYGIRYIRVYAWRNDTWKLISHHSTAQWPLNN